MEELGIYSSCYVEAEKVVGIMHTLIKHGYKNIYAFVEQREDEELLSIHINQDKPQQ